MRKLKDAGKFVITIDSDIAPSAAEARRLYIGTNNTKAGEAAGKAAADAPARRGGRSPSSSAPPPPPTPATGSTASSPGPAPKFVKPPVEIFEDQADMNRAQSLRRDRHHQAPRRRRDARPLLLQRPQDRRRGRQGPRVPQEDHRRHLRPRRAGRRAPREGRHRRLGLPEPLRDRLPGRPAAQGPDRRRQGDRRGDVPQRQRPPSTPASA